MVLSFILAKYYSYNKLSIKSLESWTTFKGQIHNHLNGMENFYNSRNPLQREQLQLNSVYGHDGIITKESYAWDEVTFDLLLKENSIIYLYLTVNNKHNKVIRLGCNNKYKSSYLLLDESGKLKDAKHLNLCVNVNEWNRIKVVKNANFFVLYVNNDKFKLNRFERSYTSHLGFKGHVNDAYVDNIRIIGHDLNFLEEFSNNKSFKEVFPFFFVLIYFMMCLFYAFSLVGKIAYSIFLFISFNLILFFSSLYLYDFYYWSGLYTFKDTKFDRIEQFRRDLFFNFISFDKNNDYINLPLVFNEDNKKHVCHVTSSDLNSASPSYQYNCNVENSQKNFNLLFVGSSQMSGSGSNSLHSSFAAKIIEKLYFHYQGNINADLFAKHGENALTLLNLLKNDKVLNKAFDLVVVNLGYNDLTHNELKHGFVKNSQILVNYLKNKYNAKILFFLEPFDIEFEKFNPYLGYTDKLENLKNADFYFLYKDNPQILFNDQGLAWWDYVHMTQYAQNIYADYIFNILIKNYIN